MKKAAYSLFAFAALVGPSVASADNPLTHEQLLSSIQLSLNDYAGADPDMARSISGLRTVTTGANALVSIEMNADGMKMTAKYLCVPRGEQMACRAQQ